LSSRLSSSSEGWSSLTEINIAIIIRESLVQGLGETFGTIWGVWVSCWSRGLILWLSLDHHADGNVVVVCDVFLLVSIGLEDRVEGVVSNNLSETLESNRFDAIEFPGWGNLEGDSSGLIDGNINGLGHLVEVALLNSLGAEETLGSWHLWGSRLDFSFGIDLSNFLGLFVMLLVVLLGLFLVFNVLFKIK